MLRILAILLAMTVSAAAQTTQTFPNYVSGLSLAIVPLTGTESFYVLQNGQSRKVSAGSIVGNPGGSNTQVQFNNSGSFGGNSNLTFVSPTLIATSVSPTSVTAGTVTAVTVIATTASPVSLTAGAATANSLVLNQITANATPLTISGGSITGTNVVVPGISVAGTLNTSGVVDGAAFFSNLTKTACGAECLSLDLQTGGTSEFAVRLSDGQLKLNNGVAFLFITSGANVGFHSASQTAGGGGNTNDFLAFTALQYATRDAGSNRGIILGRLYSAASIETSNGAVWGWSNSASDAANSDTGLSRDSAGVVDFGNGSQGDKSGTIIAATVSATGFTAAGKAGVSCAAGTVSTATLTITDGIVTHC